MKILYEDKSCDFLSNFSLKSVSWFFQLQLSSDWQSGSDEWMQNPILWHSQLSMHFITFKVFLTFSKCSYFSNKIKFLLEIFDEIFSDGKSNIRHCSFHIRLFWFSYFKIPLFQVFQIWLLWCLVLNLL